MKKKTVHPLCQVWQRAFVLAARFGCARQLVAQVPYHPPTAVKYQGVLTDGNSPANGLYDFEFRFFTEATNGLQVGGAVTNRNLPVSNGLFTAGIVTDVGELAANEPAPRFLQVGARPGGSDVAFTVLLPRQPLLSTPYAWLARDSVRVGGLTSSNFASAAHMHAADDLASGEVSPARGGLGVDTSAAAAGTLLQATGSSSWTMLPPGTNGQMLVSTSGMVGNGLLGWASLRSWLEPAEGIALDEMANPYRVRVKFDWLASGATDQSNTWSRVQVFNAGMGWPNGGTFFLPEVNDEVLVTFEQGHPERPVVVGRLWNNTDSPSRHGPSRQIQAGDATRPNRDGGDVILRPGVATGSGSNGAVRVQGALEIEDPANLSPRLRFSTSSSQFDASQFVDFPTFVVGPAPGGDTLTVRAGDASVTNQPGGDIILQPGAGRGSGQDGIVRVQRGVTLSAPNDTNGCLVLAAGGSGWDYDAIECVDYIIAARAGSSSNSLLIQVSDASGTNQNGGDVLLQPGRATGNRTNGAVLVKGILEVTDTAGQSLRLMGTISGQYETGFVDVPSVLALREDFASSLVARAGDAKGTNQNGGEIILQPGAGTGSGSNGTVRVLGPLELNDHSGQGLRLTGSLSGRYDGSGINLDCDISLLGSFEDALVLRAADAHGTNQNGGDLMLQAGVGTGSGTPGAIRLLAGKYAYEFDGHQGGWLHRHEAEPPGSLRYDFTNSQWQVSSAGGPFLPIATASISGGVNADLLDGFDAATAFAPAPRIYVSGADGFLPSGTVNSASIANSSIGSSDLASDAVTTGTIADGAVTSIKLAAEAVTTATLFDAAITTPKLADGAVTSEKVRTNLTIQDLTIVKKLDVASLALFRHCADGTHNQDALIILCRASTNGEQFLSWKINDVKIGGIDSNGVVHAPAFIGDGSNLTSVIPAADSVTTAQLAPGAVTSADLDANLTTQNLDVDGSLAVQQTLNGTAAKMRAETVATQNPSVANTSVLKLQFPAGPAPPIVSLPGGVDGQTVTVVNKGTDAVLVQSAPTLRLKGGLPANLGEGDTLTLCSLDGVWYEASRSDN
jgi:hypothetical protein